MPAKVRSHRASTSDVRPCRGSLELDDAAAERRGDRLVAQTHAQDRSVAGQLADDGDRAARLGAACTGRARAQSPAGRRARTSAGVVASLRTTSVSWPSRWK